MRVIKPRPRHARIQSPLRFCRGGFTVIELLVVVGIIVLLAGILLPMLYKTYRSASKTRLAADLNTIGVALDAYKSDFGDYPRVPTPGSGFAILGKALVGPFDSGTLSLQQNPTPGGPPFKAGAVGFVGANQHVALRETSNGVGSADWTPAPGGPIPPFIFTDGADGPGFRVRYDPITKAGGKITPAYLPPGKFKQQGLALLDHNGSPILYFPASPVKINLNVAGSLYVASPGPTQTPMFNFDDNGTLALSMMRTDTIPTAAAALTRMQMMMGLRGDYLVGGSKAGQLMPGLTPVNQPYLLWSPGADGFFGPLEDITQMNGDLALIDRAVRKCDDVANISLPQ